VEKIEGTRPKPMHASGARDNLGSWRQTTASFAQAAAQVSASAQKIAAGFWIRCIAIAYAIIALAG